MEFSSRLDLTLDSNFPLTLHLSLSGLGQRFISFEILRAWNTSLRGLMLWSKQPSWERLNIAMHLSLATCWMFCRTENIWHKPLADAGTGQAKYAKCEQDGCDCYEITPVTPGHIHGQADESHPEPPSAFFSSSLYLVYGTTETAGVCNSVQGTCTAPLPQQRHSRSREIWALLLVSDSWAKGQ